jgi:hypothetical protein
MSAATELAEQLPTIQMFWFGAPLSRIEKLSLASFVAHGHPVNLFVYEDVGAVPRGVQLRDAAKVLPREWLFRHRRTGSVGLFADWFRYRLLYERGGIWADSDVVCLAPFDYGQTVLFAWETEHYVNNAVLGLPPQHELAAWMAENCEHPNRALPYDDWSMRLRKWKRRYLEGDRRDRVRWGENGPKGLTLAARHFGLLDGALPSWHFYPVPAERWRELFEAPPPAAPLNFGPSRAVHLWNSMMPTHGFDKNGSFPITSPFEQLWRRFMHSA